MEKEGPLAGPGLVTRRLRVRDADVVWLRAVLDAYEGLASLYGDGSGVVTLLVPETRASELDALLATLCHEAPIAPLP